MATLSLSSSGTTVYAQVTGMESGYASTRNFVFTLDGGSSKSTSSAAYATESPTVSWGSLSYSTTYSVSVTITSGNPSETWSKTLDGSITTEDEPDPLTCTITIDDVRTSKDNINVEAHATTRNAAGRCFRLYGTCNGQGDYTFEWYGNTTSYGRQVAWGSLSPSTEYSWDLWLQEKVNDSWVDRAGVAYTSGTARTNDCDIYFGTSGMGDAYPSVNGEIYYGTSSFDTGDVLEISISGLTSEYEFVRWTLDGSTHTTNMTFTYVVDGSDHRFVGIGQEAKHQVTIQILNNLGEAKGNKTPPSGAGKYSKDASVTVTTDVLKYYTFNGWYVNDTLKSSNLSYTFTMPNNDITCVAKYTRTGTFNWTNTISSGQPITNLTASDWKAIQDKIDLFYAQDRTWTRAGTGSGQQPRINAAMFNEVRNAIAGITSPSPSGTNPLTSQKTANDKVMASYFNGNGSISDDSIKAALNRIISAG